ncbi:hypothetical protein CONLIGDRAFT_641101 [Coniochaeta ligniaria NRRL 30616]|uniref:Uncharacterized protein n=1 Tax=Coniochaeta ligniaria NRRL 30616 TaxID=1408157 RepID=A0A1J7J3K4_9PEZI|nr:hypothetical protein CONLIGDRAFT_641101 [Coniochaeta ligniaria NRRL 30616]
MCRDLQASQPSYDSRHCREVAPQSRESDIPARNCQKLALFYLHGPALASELYLSWLAKLITLGSHLNFDGRDTDAEHGFGQRTKSSILASTMEDMGKGGPCQAQGHRIDHTSGRSTFFSSTLESGPVSELNPFCFEGLFRLFSISDRVALLI